MVGNAWERFVAEIRRWQAAGRTVEFWWRDDDATRPAQSLERLLELSSRWRVPLALAVIPALADRALFAALPGDIGILQHGVDHRNRAAAGEKKTEFPAAEPSDAALARLADGARSLAEMAGARSLEVLAPPWNRFPAHLAARLASCGFRGLSRYGARRGVAQAYGLIEINTHVDLIAWRSGRGFVGEEQALALATRHLAARREGQAEPDEPTGWLTHHADHDEAAWRFLARLFERLAEEHAVRWRAARELFAAQPVGAASP